MMGTPAFTLIPIPPPLVGGTNSDEKYFSHYF